MDSFLRCGGNCLHRILEWILFEMWRVCTRAASTEFLGRFFLRCGGNCLHRILEWILFEMWRELPPQNFVEDSLFIIRANEIVIENSKKGKMNTVFAILKVIGNKFTNSRNTGLSFGSSRKCTLVYNSFILLV
jgi:hypothetical protein